MRSTIRSSDARSRRSNDEAMRYCSIITTSYNSGFKASRCLLLLGIDARPGRQFALTKS
jgi:hypothetical protein